MALKQKKTTRDNPVKAEQGRITFEDLLVAVGKTRSRDAFVRLFEHYAPRVKSFLMKGGVTQELADELAQETMLAVWQKAATYDPAQAAAGTWIFTIARNKRIDLLRRNARPAPDLSDPSMPVYSPEAPDEAFMQEEKGRALAGALEKLPPEQASLVQKAFFEEKTHTDIAKETGIPLGTVKSRIRLALERLRQNLGAGENDER